MIWDEVSSQYCEDAGRRCNNRKDIMKKFRRFFEEQLEFPLPLTKRKFLNSIYSDRSSFVHRYLMGDEKLRVLMPHIKETVMLQNSLDQLELLTNVSLINWLERI